VAKPIHGESKTRHHRETKEFQIVIGRLAQKLRRLRSSQGWTIEQAAEAMQIEPSHLKRLEAATANPTLALLVTAAKAFGIGLLELLGKD
jgi:transcriptional regulator with XRE-family HTH domain